MLQNRRQSESVLAAGASCPVPVCRALAITSTLATGPVDDTPGRGRDWVFTCPRCGFEFRTMPEELLFHSVPMSWFLASVSQA
jgi:hypothetical protein